MTALRVATLAERLFESHPVNYRHPWSNASSFERDCWERVALSIVGTRAQVDREAALIAAGNDLNAALNPLVTVTPEEAARRRKHWESAKAVAS